jgi:hypothetical protein
MQRLLSVAVLAVGLVLVTSAAAGSPGADRRLTNDASAYTSEYTIATGTPYTDDVLAECSVARGRQNEPADEIDPRDPQVIIGSSNDYCGVYAGSGTTAHPVASGPIWLGYYRSENAGASFTSSLVPGYPGDTSPYAALAKIRTASAGDPVIAWDNHGRLFMGSESSDDPSGSKKTFGDVWVARFDNPAGPDGQPSTNDGKRFLGSTIVAKGSSAPNLLGKFNDKTSIEADRTGGACDGNVYFSWSRFTGNSGGGTAYFARSTDHGASFSSPMKLSTGIHDVQFPDIAVTGNGHVYVTFREFSSQGQGENAVLYVKSTDCGRTFSKPQVITTFEQYDATDQIAPEAEANGAKPGDSREDPGSPEDEGAGSTTARDCGDFDSHCASGYTFFRRDTQVRSTADQADKTNEWVFIVYDPSKPGTEVQTGTTYWSVSPGVGSQSAIYYTRLDGTNGSHTGPDLVDNEAAGHQLFPDIAVSGGVLHALWWDSRNDEAGYSPARPVGNDADGHTAPSLDVYASTAPAATGAWSTALKLTDVQSNPNYEQFADRTVPFAGDYLWISAVGSATFGTWTDWRDVNPGAGDPREAGDADADMADVAQCRTFDSASGSWSGDTCPHAGGLDQNIYGDQTP